MVCITADRDCRQRVTHWVQVGFAKLLDSKKPRKEISQHTSHQFEQQEQLAAPPNASQEEHQLSSLSQGLEGPTAAKQQAALPSPPQSVGEASSIKIDSSHDPAGPENQISTGSIDAYHPLVKGLGYSTPQTYRSAITTRAHTPELEAMMGNGIESAKTGGLEGVVKIARPENAVTTATTTKTLKHIDIVPNEANTYPNIVSRPFSATSNNSTAGSATLLQTDSEIETDHILFVCTKCQRQKVKDKCEESCGPSYFKCRLGNISNSGDEPGKSLLGDMEDLIVPMTPSYANDGRKKKTGQILYENIKALHEQTERLKSRAACHGGPEHQHHDQLRRGEINCPNAVQPRLKIVPVECLSYCDYANVVAYSAPNKFSYQVAQIKEDNPEEIEALMSFAEQYIESSDGFSKSKTRPNQLKGKVVARIPPLTPSFQNRSLDK
ncbi:hypothetical protein H4219_001268 [Mycoemilia scoparia]|uniref:Uncharacterized protein n=1 Tax=Mycoemilia scoparia TaxID=417184 RepID=A0A9W8A0R3_9FUNG|nr:hypothetical protein H4219_001268 [Mycoemilia scoparia]